MVTQEVANKFGNDISSDPADTFTDRIHVKNPAALSKHPTGVKTNSFTALKSYSHLYNSTIFHLLAAKHTIPRSLIFGFTQKEILERDNRSSNI